MLAVPVTATGGTQDTTKPACLLQRAFSLFTGGSRALVSCCSCWTLTTYCFPLVSVLFLHYSVLAHPSHTLPTTFFLGYFLWGHQSHPRVMFPKSPSPAPVWEPRCQTAFWKFPSWDLKQCIKAESTVSLFFPSCHAPTPNLLLYHPNPWEHHWSSHSGQKQEGHGRCCPLSIPIN